MNLKLKRIIVTTVILFCFLYSCSAQAPCQEPFTWHGAEAIRGIVNNPDGYYRNLIIQDIALSNQQSFEEVSVRFQYELDYIVNQCHEDRLEISVSSLKIKCDSLYYRDFDVSGSVRPEKADLVFHIYNKMGILADSVVFFGISIESDSSLYSYIQFPKDRSEGAILARFSRAVFYFTKKSYNDFRDRIMEIDRYYAASAMADSTIRWTILGFLKETDTLPLLFLRQFELERILIWIDPVQTTSFIPPGFPEPQGLQGRFDLLSALNTRYCNLLKFQVSDGIDAVTSSTINFSLRKYIDLLDYYHRLAFSRDFRDMSFLENLASPVFSNATLFRFFNHLEQLLPDNERILYSLAESASRELFDRGNVFSDAGDQMRALKYYESAYKVAILGGCQWGTDSLLLHICRNKKYLVDSYLEISRKALNADNPGMSAAYFRDAIRLLNHDRFTSCSNHVSAEFECWLYSAFRQRAIELLNKGNYGKALNYLDEIQSQCTSSENYPCPPDLPALFKEARKGAYLAFISKAVQLVSRDELAEAEFMLQQASDLRLRSGYAIPADPSEYRMEGIFRQAHYDEYVQEGLKYLRSDQPDAALYYFNKAFILEHGNLPEPDIRLLEYR